MTKNNAPPHADHYYPHKLCGAHAKQTGLPCKAWAMNNGRCRLHGGKSTGAKQPHKRITHGLRTKESMKQRKETRELIKASRDLLKQIS